MQNWFLKHKVRELNVKRLLKYFCIFILGFCGLLIAGAAFLHFANIDAFRARIAEKATHAVGRQVEINGHIDINLFPHPEMILNRVSLANAEWGSEPIMASVGHADAAISFLSLFTERIIVRRLRLNDVVVLLEKNEQLTGNWVLGPVAESAEAEKEKTGRDPDKIVDLPLMVDFAEFGNLTVTVREPERADQVYHISSFNLQPNESDNLILKSSGEISGNPMVLSSRISSRESVLGHGPVNTDLQASFGEVEIICRLSTTQLSTLADFHGEFSITIQDIRKALQQVKVEAPLTGPLTAEGTVTFDNPVFRVAASAAVEGITATVDGMYSEKQLEINSTVTPLNRVGELINLQGLSAETVTVNIRGTQSGTKDFEVNQFQADIGENRLAANGRINENGDATMSLTLASPDLNTLLETLPAIDLNAKASIHFSDEKIEVSALDARFDKSDINGDIVVSKGKKPNITVNLSSGLLDLRPFSKTSDPDEPAEKELSKETVKTSHKKEAESENQYVFKETPLQLAPLQSVETEVKLSVDHFYYDIAELKNIKIHASIHDGHADAKFKCTSPNEGQAAGKIDLKVRDKKAVVDTVLSLSDFRMSVLKSEGIGPEEVPPMSVSIELATAGSSPRELAAASNGRVLFTQGSGKINNNIMKMVSNDIIMQLTSALNPFAQNEEFSNWDCTVLSINIVNGLATIDGMLAQGENVMIVGGGDIDLKTEELNVEFNTKPRSGVGISADMFVTPFVKVQGTLANPGIGLNKKGTLLTGGAAFATGGLSLVLQRAFDRATAEGDHCEEMLKAVGEHTRFSF